MIDAHQARLRTILPTVALGLTTLAFIIAKTGRDALFFQGSGGLLQLPLIYMNIAMAALPLALIFVKAMKIFGARPARLGILLFVAIVMASVAPFLQPGGNLLMLVMFMFVPATFGLVFASLWLLASDLFEKTEKREAARAFSKMGAGTLAGGMLGGLLSKGLVSFLDAQWFFLIAAFAIVSVVALVSHIHRRFPTQIGAKTTDHEKKKSGFLTPLSNNYALTLFFISMMGALAGLLIDFQFYAAATSAQMDSKGNANFFANFYILLNFSSLLLQLLATPKIQDRVGLRGGLMVLPIALIGGASFASAAATALSRSVLRVTEGGLRSSVHRSIWEQAFIAVDSRERSAVKVVVDGIGARIAEAVGAATVLVWLKTVAVGEHLPMPLDTRWMAWVTLATVAVWLLITQRLRVQVEKDQGIARSPLPQDQDIDCERFPDQCPCTTEMGKGIG